jgi:hypothetical protein
MQYSPQQPLARLRRRREIGFEAETGSPVTPELDGDRRGHRTTAFERVVGQCIFADPPIALFETPSSPPPRLGQPVLEPHPIIVVEPREDPRNPPPVIVYVRFHVVFVPCELLYRTRSRLFYAFEYWSELLAARLSATPDPLCIISR